MTFLQELETVLKGDERFVSQNGQLLKPRVQDAVSQLDAHLIRQLMASPVLKEHFFKNVDGITIFDQEKFMWVVNYKEFLPDSYTSYRNKIGLSANDHDLLTQSNEVSLVWPYKDCVLEGGQDKEDEQRDEIFYNETLAPDEVGRLLAPKAFSNATRYSAEGEEHVTEFDENDNLIIKGNNLLALSSLLEQYEGQVKCIYIDPPYYFQKAKGDSFKYNSDFKFSTWLSFMKHRLVLARRLLRKDGTIWIQVGEDGMHYLKVLCDQIFGSDHFVGTLPRRVRSGKSDVPFNLSQDFDFVLLYSNASSDVPAIGRSVERKYYETPDYPGRPWRLADLTKQTTAKERPNSYFTMVDPKTGKKYPASEKRTWAITPETFDDYYEAGYIVFPDDYDFLNITKPQARKFKDQDEETGKLSAVISDFLIKDFLQVLLSGSKNKNANEHLQTLIGLDAFSFPKPEELIESILNVATNSGDLVLDFFLGSGTTAAVAHKMGRRYIGVEQMDYVSSVTIPRLQQVIAGEQGGVSKAQEWKGGGSFVYVELAEQSEKLMRELQDAATTDEVQGVLDQATERGLLRPSVLPDQLADSALEFAQLSLDEQKRAVAELIDKNRLYINASDAEDAELGLSEADIAFTKSFYQKGE